MNPQHPNFIYWLAATHLDGIGPITFRKIFSHFNNIEKIFSATQNELKNAKLKSAHIDAIKNVNWKIIERDQKWCEEFHCELIPFADENYPTLLREIESAPIALFIQGDTALISSPQLAMVGSRNPTPPGREIAEHFAFYLAKAGLTITSGLALGIDAASHNGALAAEGKTIAVTGTGLKEIYPRSHHKLAKNILNAGGALVSEFPPYTQPKAKNFPMRNRVISGLSLGVLVVEAAIRSGSLITARFALEQNREVFAIPGSIHNPLARGCHELIRQGAKLVETAKDILEELSSLNAVITEEFTVDKEDNLHPNERNILRHIGYEVASLDVIIARTGLTAEEVSSMLLMLELNGFIRTVPGGYIQDNLMAKKSCLKC